MTSTSRPARSPNTSRRLLAAVALLAAGCSIPIENQAEAISEDDVAYGLLETTTSTSTTVIPVLPSESVTFYWHNPEGRLVLVEKGRENVPDPGLVLLELVEGPLEADLEVNANLITVLDSTMAPSLSGPDVNGVHRIQIDRLAESGLSTDQAEEFVCTATQFDAIDRIEIIDSEGVTFSLSGKGAVALDGPARAEDFGDCVPDPPPVEETVPEEAEPESTTTTTENAETPSTTTN